VRYSSIFQETFNQVSVIMKRILTSCFIGVLLTSTVLAKPASAQVQVIFGENDRRDLRQDQREYRERQRRIYEQRQREQRDRFERQRDQRDRYERQRDQRDRYERQRDQRDQREYHRY